MKTNEARRSSAHQIRIEDFMRKAGQEVPSEPTMPSAEIRLLRAKLIFEEALETITALGVDVMVPQMYAQHGPVAIHDKLCTLRVNPRRAPNMIEIADGCADISVVTIGTLSACGIADKMLLLEVDESNMRKFGPGCSKREDGKHVKPPDWKKPDILGVLQNQSSTPRGWVGFTDEEAKQLQSQRIEEDAIMDQEDYDARFKLGGLSKEEYEAFGGGIG